MKISDQFLQLEETIDGFFRRDKTESELRKQFLAYRDQTLTQIPTMGDVLKEFPYFGAAAFIGKFCFSAADSEELKALSENATEANLQLLVEKKNMKVAQSAKPAWDFLLKEQPQQLAIIVALCHMVQGNVNLKFLNP